MTEITQTKIEYVAPEYLSHDAPGYDKVLSRGGILSTEDPEEPEWIVEGEIEPVHGKRIARALNCHDDMLTALRTATQHIEHMAAFIGKMNAGYSFESLGEDMPGIRTAIAKAEGRS